MQSPSADNHDLLVWQGFVARLARLRDAAADLCRPTAFDVSVAHVSDADVAAVAVHGRPSTGDFPLTIQNLSQAHKLITGTFEAGATGLEIKGSLLVNGCRVSINPADSLNDIAVKFTRSAANVRAQTVHLGPNDFRLILTSNRPGADGAITLAAVDGDALDRLGLAQPSAQLVAARDARFNLNGVDHTSPDNTIVDAIHGITLTLLRGQTKDSQAACTVTVDIDTNSAVAAEREFVDALNDCNTGDSSDRTVKVTASIAEAIKTASGCVTIAHAGLSLDANGSLVIDEEALASSLATDQDRVYRVFAMCVDSDNPAVTFVSASARTLESPAAGFKVNITSAASTSIAVADVAQTEPSVEVEHLTFTGPLFPTTVRLTLPAGSTAADTQSRINRSARLNGRVTASLDGSTALLLLTSRHGAAGDFEVTSDLDPACNNSGMGPSPKTSAGVDVAGTIDGEPATGEGRTLTGCAGNSRTEALQILVTATEPGDCGNIYVHRGLADRIYHVIHQVLEPGQSASGRAGDLNAQIGDTEQQIARMNDQLGAFGEYLHQTLSAMDLRVHHLREQAESMSRRTARRQASRTF